MKTQHKLGLLAIAMMSFILVSFNSYFLGTYPPGIPSGLINGYVYTEINVNNAVKKIYIPDVQVSIIDNNNNVIEKLITDLDGGFRTKSHKKGTYVVAFAKNGFGNNRYKVSVVNPTNHPGLLKITAPPRFVAGRVLLRDRLPACFRNPLYSAEFSTLVQNTQNNTRVQCNISGEYVMPGATEASLRSSCENANVNHIGNAWSETILPNTNPVMRGVLADEAGKFILRTVPNSTVHLVFKSTDAENHKLKYQYFPNGGKAVSISDNEVNWTLPNVKGNYQMEILAFDGFGGVSKFYYSIDANSKMVSFSGRVFDVSTQKPVNKALISVNNATTRSDENGNYSISVPEEKNKFVMNIEKAGYMLCSRIYYFDASNIKINLVPNTTVVFDPTTDIVLQEKEDKYTKFSRRVFIKKNKERTTKLEAVVTKREPAVIKIPANAIVDENGNKVSDKVAISLRSVDLFDRNGLMMGDYQGIGADGKSKRLDSFGAIDVQIRDANNPEKKYKLDKDAVSEIIVPIEGVSVSLAPAQIPLWDYNQEKGIWEEIGKLEKNGNNYQGKTDRFSALNADLAFADAACLYLKNNPVAPFSPDYVVQVEVLTIPIKSLHTFTIGELDKGVSRLPPNTDVLVKVFAPGADVNTAEPVDVQLVTTNGGNPGVPDIDPTVDFLKNNCGPDVLIPFIRDLENVPPNNRFLARKTNSIADTQNYYNILGVGTQDAGGYTFTLNDWKTRAGFNLTDDAADEAKAIYYNHGDLAFWRDMHMKSTAGRTAYYVSNYRNDTEAKNKTNVIATVAMEFSTVSGGGTTPITQFYVFGADGRLVDKANLDGFGLKAVPGLCIVCHGGTHKADALGNGFSSLANLESEYTNAADPENMPQFLPFDLQVDNFKYSGLAGLDRGSQEGNFRLLNQKILSLPKTNAIRDFIKKTYGDANLATTTLPVTNFLDNQVVGNWDSPLIPAGSTETYRNFYLNVVATSCRTCHMSRTVQMITNIRTNPSSFSYAVCPPSGSDMPNSRQTFINLWSSPTRRSSLIRYVGTCL